MKRKVMPFLLVLLCVIFAGCSNNTAETQSEAQSDDSEVATEDESDVNEEDTDAAVNEKPKEMPSLETDNDAEEDEGTTDEELKLNEIYGKAYQLEDIEYDEEKKYYVLEMKAGLYNYTNTQDIDEKWIAFALPDGVFVPDVEEIPSGLVLVSLPDGHAGIALKVPNLKGISEESYSVEIPLIGVPDDNDPNENLYLYNVDGNKEQAELVGEIKSTREIDFSVMQETP